MAATDPPRGDVYIRLLGLAHHERLRTEVVADAVHLDYRIDPATGESELVGVEVLAARTIRVDATQCWPLEVC